MSYNLFIEYLDFLLEKKLLEKKTSNPSNSTIYQTTDKGEKMLENLKLALEHVK